jgi:type II secretory pathway pseudopilin PulG
VDHKEKGLTLVELAVIVLLLGVFSAIVVTRFDAISAYRQNGELRTFLNTWQFLLNEAAADGNSYRLIVDLDSNSYLVRQEIPLPPEATENVDLNKGLRLRSEKERRKRKEDEGALTPDEAFRLLDEQERVRSLDELFALSVYVDPGNNVVLSQPINFPSMGQEQGFSGSIKIQSVTVDGVEINRGRASLHFTPQGAQNIAVITFNIDGQIRSALLNPLSGESQLITGATDPNYIARGHADEGE